MNYFYSVMAFLLTISYILVGNVIYTYFTDAHKQLMEKQCTIPEVTKETVINNLPNKVYKMRVTAYHNHNGKKSALNEPVQSGRTAAVSPACIDLLGEKVYIEGHGIRYVNDLAAKWLDDKFGVCTIDLAVGSKENTHKIGGHIRTVVKLN